MTDVTGFQLASVALHATTMVVWGAVALREWQICRALRPRNPLFRLLRNLAALGSMHFALQLVICLMPVELLEPVPRPWLIPLLILDDWALILVAPTAWQLVRYWGGQAEPPSRRAVLAAYGSATGVMLLSLTFPFVLAGFKNPLWAYIVIRNAYLIVVFGMAVRRMAQHARRGRWRPGAAANVIVRADIWFFAGGVLLLAVVIGWLAVAGLPGRASPTGFTIDALINILVTVPIAARELTYVVCGLLFAGGMVAATTVAFLGGQALAAPLAAVGATTTASIVRILVLAVVVTPAQAMLRRAIHALVLRRRSHLWDDLRAFLHTLSPEEGAVACCRQALTELVRVLGLRGAAILLRDGESIVEGEFAIDALRDAWPRGEALDTLPPGLVTLDYEAELPRPVTDALMQAEVVSVLAITSPRRRWGVLFATSGLLEPAAEENEAVQAFVAQLALLLDTAALLERTVAVERSLAHAEKLGVIGELASRIAHEIRNPVSAARSLAQLLVRDPTAPENAEYATLIMEELDRVERQVRSLLHFSRREEYRFEPVDLCALIQATLGALRPRLVELNVHLESAVPRSVVVQADREKLRQVLVNLLHNALDALASAEERRLAMAVSSANGTALVEIVDSGAGVPPEAFDRLFEPFFTLKPNGTGLGLAIARRTIEAHGGRISAARATPHGMAFRIELPKSTP